MQKSNEGLFKRILIYTAEIIIFFALEQVLNLKFGTTNSAEFFILVPIFVSISLFEQEFVGLVFGIFAGILTDYNFGAGIGICAAMFGIFGYTTSVISNYFLRANVITQIIMSTVILFCTEIVKLTIAFSGQQLNFIAAVWYNIFCKSLIISLPVFVLVFYFTRAISYKFGGKERTMN